MHINTQQHKPSINFYFHSCRALLLRPVLLHRSLAPAQQRISRSSLVLVNDLAASMAAKPAETTGGNWSVILVPCHIYIIHDLWRTHLFDLLLGTGPGTGSNKAESSFSSSMAVAADVYKGELTPLQRHVAFFDRNKDGVIYPAETYQGVYCLLALY